MKRLIAAPLWSLLLALVAVFATTGAAAAPVPPGPRLTLLRLALSAGREEIVTAGGDPPGGGLTRSLIRVFGGAAKFGALVPGSGAPAWFPGGKRIAFSGTGLIDPGQPLALSP